MIAIGGEKRCSTEIIVIDVLGTPRSKASQGAAAAPCKGPGTPILLGRVPEWMERKALRHFGRTLVWRAWFGFDNQAQPVPNPYTNEDNMLSSRALVDSGQKTLAWDWFCCFPRWILCPLFKANLRSFSLLFNAVIWLLPLERRSIRAKKS